MSADPAKADQNGAVTPYAEATSPPSADPITMPPTTPVRVVTEPAVALLGLTAVGLLAPRMTALTRRVGQGPAGI